MSFVKITLWCESTDTDGAPDWRNHSRFLDRCRKGGIGVKVLLSKIEDYEPDDSGAGESTGVD